MAEIRRLDPKPGRAFGGATVQPVAPDVIVRAARDGSWLIELNSETLPRVLVNQTYAAKVSRKGERRRGQELSVAMPADRQLADQEPGAAGADHI